MKERKANKEEAAAFNAALRGKSLMAQKRDWEQKNAARLKNLSATSLASGSLPPTGLADPVQIAAMSKADKLTHAIVVAYNTPKPVIPAVAPIIAPAVIPTVPAVPQAPTAPVIPEPLLPELPVDNLVVTNFDQVAGASFASLPEATEFRIYYVTEAKDVPDRLIIDFPSGYDKFENSTYVLTSGVNVTMPIFDYYYPSFHIEP